VNKAHSVSARLLQIAKARNEDFHFVLVRYGSERLLYRIGMHPLLRTFILKGPRCSWSGKEHGFARPATPPRLNAYPMETVVSEKFLAIATLGMSNTRMKDYFDLAVLGRRFPLDAAICALAIKNTCHARRIDIPKELPIGLTASFASDIDKIRQWNAFANRSGLAIQVGDLASVLKVPSNGQPQNSPDKQ